VGHRVLRRRLLGTVEGVGVTAESVIGCVRCGKPAALVGDEVPEHGHCPWCRGGPTVGAPAVSDLWEREQEAALVFGRDLSAHPLSVAAHRGGQ